MTRALVLELCRDLDIPCEEAALPLDALAEADEAFLTSTVREVQTITQVDGDALPHAPGPVTRVWPRSSRPSSAATSTRSPRP